MPLESLQPDARSKITNFSVESPETKEEDFGFDIKKEINPVAWEGFEQDLIHASPNEIGNILKDIKLLSSKRFKGLDLSHLPNFENGPDDFIRLAWLNNKGTNSFFGTILEADLKIIWPEKCKKHIEETDKWDEIESDIRSLFKSGENWEDNLKYVFAGKILYPEKFEEFKEDYLDAELWPKVKKELEWLEISDTLKYMQIVGYTKLIWSEKSNKELGLDKENWQLMKKLTEMYGDNVEKGKNAFWTVYADYRFFLKVLSAQKIEVDENGLKVLDKAENQKEKVPPQPKTINY